MASDNDSGASGPASEAGAPVLHRGVMLPEGMTPELANSLEKVICREMSEEGSVYPFELGIMCFSMIRESLAAKSPR
jgi:hypothetical protein